MSITSVIKLKEDERVVRIVRHHSLVYILPSLLAFLLIAAPLFLMLPLFSFGRWGQAAFGLSILAGIIFALRLFVRWYWNAGIITNRRIVDIDQRGLFERMVSEAPYDKIQDISYRVKGVWGTLFNYGTVIVQTAGSSPQLELLCVRDPKDVHHLITETMETQARVRAS